MTLLPQGRTTVNSLSEKEANGLTYVRGIFGGVTHLLKLERGRDETGAHFARHLLLLLFGALWVVLTVTAGNCQGKKKATKEHGGYIHRAQGQRLSQPGGLQSVWSWAAM